MTFISVGPNVHGLPNENAIKIYEKYSTGSAKGNKVYTTEEKGTMKLELKDDGRWLFNVNQ
jgi:beta-lactamase superfamily II metal-dependent hydrolase